MTNINGKEKIEKVILMAYKNAMFDIYLVENKYISFKNSSGIKKGTYKLTQSDIKDILNELLEQNQSKITEMNDRLKKGERFLFGSSVEINDEKEKIKLRVRGQVYNDINGINVNLRILFSKNVDYKELTKYSGITEKLDNIFKIGSGLIIITGGTGQGKSTLVTSYIEKILKDENQALYIKTIEEPIEHIFDDSKSRSTISQIEIGTQIRDYEKAIETGTKDNPNIVYIQEISTKGSAIELKTILNSAKLVIITLHTSNVAQAISRLLSLMKEDESDEMFNRRVLAQESICIIGQNLVYGYDVDEKNKRVYDEKGNAKRKIYGVQEFLNIGPKEKNFILDDSGTPYEQKLKQSLNDYSSDNISLNKILLKMYEKNMVDAETVYKKSNDISILKENIENKIDLYRLKEDFNFLENVLGI